MSKRQNKAIWKIQDIDDHTPRQLIEHVLEQYKKRVEESPGKYAGLREVALNDAAKKLGISLYIRTRTMPGIFDFAEEMLASNVTKEEFRENKKLQSYVAKREIIIAKEDFRGKDQALQLIHTRKMTTQ